MPITIFTERIRRTVALFNGKLQRNGIAERLLYGQLILDIEHKRLSYCIYLLPDEVVSVFPVVEVLNVLIRRVAYALQNRGSFNLLCAYFAWLAAQNSSFVCVWTK